MTRKNFHKKQNFIFLAALRDIELIHFVKLFSFEFFLGCVCVCVLSKKIWFCVFMMENQNEKQKTGASTSYFRLLRLN